MDLRRLLPLFLIVVAACGGGGDSAPATDPATPLEAVAPPAATPPASAPDLVAPVATVGAIAGAAIPFTATQTAGRTRLARAAAPLRGLSAAALGAVADQGLPALDLLSDLAGALNDPLADLLDIVLPDRVIDDYLGLKDKGGGGESLHDYFPTGADDTWTYLGDASLLHGADPLLLFNLPAAPAPTTVLHFALVATGGGLSLLAQEVDAGGRITAIPPLLLLPNDLHVGASHTDEGDLTLTRESGAPRTLHVRRVITLIERGPHATTHSFFADTLHFRIDDLVAEAGAPARTLAYHLYLGRTFGPTEGSATDGVRSRHTEIERATLAGRLRPDTDGDGWIDADDEDDDNDGVLDDGDNSGRIGDHPCTTAITACDDAFPKEGAEQADADGDGLGNHADRDDDNDAVPDSLDFAPFDATHDEAAYRVYLWATDPATAATRLLAVDPDTGAVETTSEAAATSGVVAVYDHLPGAQAGRRVAFIAPAAGAAVDDPRGAHLWCLDETGVRDLTPDLTRRVVSVAWEADGEGLTFGVWDSLDDPNLRIFTVARATPSAATPLIDGRAWKASSSPVGHLLAYADKPKLFTDLILWDRATGERRSLTPEEDREALFGLLRTAYSVFTLDRDPEFSADGRRLLFAGSLAMVRKELFFFDTLEEGFEERIQVWDVEPIGRARTVVASAFGVGHLHLELPHAFPALSPQGDYLAMALDTIDGEALAVMRIRDAAVTTVAGRLPPAATAPADWRARAGGWTYTDPPALILPLTGSDGAIRPHRIAVDGSPPLPLLPAGRASAGPILLSPHGRTCFFVEADTLWRTATDGSGLAPVARVAGETLRLEVAR